MWTSSSSTSFWGVKINRKGRTGLNTMKAVGRWVELGGGPGSMLRKGKSKYRSQNMDFPQEWTQRTKRTRGHEAPDSILPSFNENEAKSSEANCDVESVNREMTPRGRLVGIASIPRPTVGDPGKVQSLRRSKNSQQDYRNEKQPLELYSIERG